MYKIDTNKQNTVEWFHARLGKLTASTFSKITTPTGKLSSSSDEMINRAVAELITQEPDETFQSDAMARGSELESEALDHVNLILDTDFETVGFMEAVDDSGKSKGYGASLDAIDWSKEIFLELKCPLIHTHLKYLASGKLPKEYIMQVQGQLLVSGFKKALFVSYHPGLPTLVVEVERDEELISQLRNNLEKCVKSIREKHQKICELMEAA